MNSILEDNERQRLIPEVADFIQGGPERLKTILPGPHLIRIRTDTIPEMYAFNVVRYCESYAWVEYPVLMIKLLTPWSNIPIFSGAIDRIKTMDPPRYYKGDRVWDTLLAGLDLPFLGREVTRKAIECFFYPLVATVNPPGMRVLVVKGPEKSGKTFTLDYIRYVNSIFTNIRFKTVWVDFKKQVTSRFGPAEMIESLLDQINPGWENEGVVLPLMDVEQPSRWLLDLGRLLVDQVRSINQRNAATSNWFIVLDGFDDIKAPRETIDLIQVLASMASGVTMAPESDDLIRLVVLGFKENMPNYNGRVRIEDIQPIARKDVEVYFKRYGEYKGHALEPAALNAAIDALQIDDVHVGDGYRTRRIAQNTLRVAISIFGKP